METGLIYLMFLSLGTLVNSMIYKSIIWSPHNPIFKQGFLKCVIPMSRLTIVCPTTITPVIDSERSLSQDQLYENLWFVDRGSYDSCHVNTTNQENRLILKCDTPLALKYRTLIFRPISVAEDSLEFEREKEYHFIATSDGSKHSLKSNSGGYCLTKGMKIQIHVCKNMEDAHCKSQHKCLEILGTLSTTRQPIVPTSEGPVNKNSTTQGYEQNHTIATDPCSGHPGLRGTQSMFTLVKYQFAVGFLIAICVVLAVFSVYLGYRLRKNLRQQSGITQNGRYSLRMSTRSTTSEGADLADGVDSRELLKRNSRC